MGICYKKLDIIEILFLQNNNNTAIINIEIRGKIMKEIKDVIANNLITLRKSFGLTQNELAEKLSYSDNMVSRWERAEITPSVETLQKISDFYKVPLSSLLQENAIEEEKQETKVQDIKKFSIVLLMVTALWLIITVAFVLAESIHHLNIWKIFILGIPLTCALLLLFNGSWNKYIYRFVVLSVLVWSLLAFVYLQFLEYNIFFVFLIGIPLELALVIWAFIKPKKQKSKK